MATIEHALARSAEGGGAGGAYLAEPSAWEVGRAPTPVLPRCRPPRRSAPSPPPQAVPVARTPLQSLGRSWEQPEPIIGETA